MMYKKIAPFVVALVAALPSYAQDKILADRLLAFHEHARPEFIDVHVDKTCYSRKETLWYKVYLHNASYDKNKLSTIAYVEFADEKNNILLRHKLKCTAGLAHGQIDLPSTLPSGVYFIRAYTAWMQANGESLSFKKQIFIENNRGDVIAEHQSPVQTSLVVVPSGKDSLTIGLNKVVSGKILVCQQGGFSAFETNGKTKVSVPTTQENRSTIHVGLFSEEDELISTALILPETTIKAELKTNKAHYHPRDKFILTCKIPSGLGKGSIGDFSVSVRKKGLPSTPSQRVSTIVFSQTSELYPKEMMVYPASTVSMPPIDFKVENNMVSEPVASSSLNIKDIIQTVYKLENDEPETELIKLPSDHVYRPADFYLLPDLETFIKEIIPQAKIKSKNNLKTLLLRNIENSNKIYFYDKPPLVLVNNQIVTNIEELIHLKPADIETIEITWRTASINKCGIQGLADHGIFAVYTKTPTAIAHESTTLYQDFHSPVKFSVPNYSRKAKGADRIPDFRDIVYWAPNIRINESAEVTFFLPDDLGEFEVEVVGYTDDGQKFTEQKTFNVTFE